MSIRWPLLVLVSLSALPVHLTAQTNDGFVGIYGDIGATVRCVSSPPGQVATLYVIATLEGASVSGITGAEFSISVSDPTGYILTYSPSPGGQVIGNPFAGGANIVWPNCQTPIAGRLSLGTVVLFNTGAGQATDIIIAQKTPPTNQNYPCALFTLCDAPIFTKACMTFPPDSVSCLLGKPVVASSIPGFRVAVNATTIGSFLEEVEASYVYGAGAPISPPYRFTQLGEEIYLNDVPFRARTVSAPLAHKASAEQERFASLCEEAGSLQGSSGSLQERIDAAYELLASDPGTLSIAKTSRGIAVKHSAYPGVTAVINMKGMRNLLGQPTLNTKSQNTRVEMFKKSASKGRLITFGQGYYVSVPPDLISQAREAFDKAIQGLPISEDLQHSLGLNGLPALWTDLARYGERMRGGDTMRTIIAVSIACYGILAAVECFAQNSTPTGRSAVCILPFNQYDLTLGLVPGVQDAIEDQGYVCQVLAPASKTGTCQCE